MSRIFHALIVFCLMVLLIPGAHASVSAPAAKNNTELTADASDFYMGLDGKAVRFKRKQNRFFNLESVNAARKAKSANHTLPDTQALRRANDYSAIEAHRWGEIELVKNERDTSSNLARLNAAAEVAYSDRSDAQFAPVFSADNGRGEFLILPDILISFESEYSALNYKQAVLDRFDMKIKNQMMFSKTDFVLSFNSAMIDYSRVFSTTRELMALPYISWAEPNMLVKLEKTQTPYPDDPLFREQWSLYNWGMNGEYCDATTGFAADIDANNAWDLMSTLSLGPRPVIAIIDDGVLLNHPDLPIWTNPNPESGIPFSENRCENDTNGCNFGHYYENGGRVYNNSDSSTVVPPSPQTVNDTHGSAVAGIAAARRNNTKGITGSAFDASILPIRLDFEGTMDCTSLVDALSYAAKYADVISNSWRLSSPGQNACQSSLDSKLNQIEVGHPAFARGNLGTPILFSAGNAAAGWRKITVPGLKKDVFTDIRIAVHFEDSIFSDRGGEGAVWIDNLSLPATFFEPNGPFFTDFETNLAPGKLPSGFSMNSASNILNNDSTDYNRCDLGTIVKDTVSGEDNGEHVYRGSGRAVKLSPAKGNCEFLRIRTLLKSDGALSFWVWVSTAPWTLEPNIKGDPFKVYVEQGGIALPVTVKLNEGRTEFLSEAYVYHDMLDYPASNASVIAVGASNDGGDAKMEDRAYFSQYGSDLDIVAPGTSIRTTSSSGSYTNLSGNSASTPMVAGIIANMLAVNSGLSLADIKTFLYTGSDQIGPEKDKTYDADNEFSYDNGFNKFYGHGRANSYKAVRLVADKMPQTYNTIAFPANPPELCTDPNPGSALDGDILDLFLPAVLATLNNN